jgi:hypothetical protein
MGETGLDMIRLGGVIVGGVCGTGGGGGGRCSEEEAVSKVGESARDEAEEMEEGAR